MGSQELCLITGDHQFPKGSNSLKRLARAALARLGAHALADETSRLMRAFPSARWSGLVSEPIQKLLPQATRSGLRSYQRELARFALSADLKPLFELGDAFQEVSTKLGVESGMLSYGCSPFLLSEARWIYPLLVHYVAPYEMVREALARHPRAMVVTLTGKSFRERMGQKLGRDRLANPWRKNPLSQTVLAAVEAIESRPKTAFKEMTADLLRFSGPDEQAGGSAKPRKPKTKPRLVFVAYKERTLRRIEALLPILMRELKDQAEVWVVGEYRGRFSEADRVRENLEKLGANIAIAAEFVSRSETKQLIQDTRLRLKQGIPSLFSHRLAVRYQGEDLFPEVEPFLRDVAQQAAPVARVYLEMANRVLEHVQPDVLVHFEEWELNRALGWLCRARSAAESPVATFAFHCLSPDSYPGLIRRFPDRLLASGAHLAQSFEKAKIWPKEKITIVGDPLADEVAGLSREIARQNLAKRLELDANRPILLLLTAYADEWNSEQDLDAYYANALRSAHNLGAQVVVKVHPQQDPRGVARAITQLNAPGATPHYLHHAALPELAAAADVAIVSLTTATPQLLMARTPVVSILPKAAHAEADKLHRYQSEAGIRVLDSSEDATETLRALLTPGPQRDEAIARGTAFAEQHVGPLDGQSRKRACEALKAALRLPETKPQC